MWQEKDLEFMELEELDLTKNMKSMEEEEKQRNEKQSKKGFIKDLLFYMVLLLLILVIIPKYVFVQVKVDGLSMNDTLQHNDILIQEKVSYYFQEPKRFDIIILKHHETKNGEQESRWVKRIIGLPGETVQIKNGFIYINGEKLEEDKYGNSKIEYYGIAKEPYKIPEEEYFVIGDNRKGIESHDSRYIDVKGIKREDIEGHVFVRIFPFDTITLFHY